MCVWHTYWMIGLRVYIWELASGMFCGSSRGHHIPASRPRIRLLFEKDISTNIHMLVKPCIMWVWMCNRCSVSRTRISLRYSQECVVVSQKAKTHSVASGWVTVKPTALRTSWQQKQKVEGRSGHWQEIALIVIGKNVDLPGLPHVTGYRWQHACRSELLWLNEFLTSH